MNSRDADELDEVRAELAAIAARCERMSEAAYPDTQGIAAELARLALALDQVLAVLTYDARERETEPGDR